MVNFPPLSPSSAWFAEFLKELSVSATIPTAIAVANRVVAFKDFSRYGLLDLRGERRILSVAVKGGNRQLRNINQDSDLRLSEHGDWRRVHLGTLEAVLGRNPFFRDIQTRIRDVYENKNISSLEEFNLAIFQVIYTFLFEGMEISHLKNYFPNPVIRERGKEIATQINFDVSILEALSIYGKETILGLI